MYCSDDEKNDLEMKARLEKKSASQYLKDKGFSDLHQRAMLTELTMCMARLIDTDRTREELRQKLAEIAQQVVEGSSVAEARTKIVEVCHANKSRSQQ